MTNPDPSQPIPDEGGGQDLDARQTMPKLPPAPPGFMGSDPLVLAGRADRVIAHQSPVFFAARQAHGDPSRVPLFLVGLATPLAKRVQTILTAHSRLHGALPLDLIPGVVATLEAWDHDAGRARVFPESLDGLLATDSLKVAGWLLTRIIQEDPTADHVLDGRGLDAALVGLVHLLFPKAPLIFCRDAPDEAGEGGALGAEAGLLAQTQNRLIDHWATALPGRIIEISREAFLADAEAVTRLLLDRLDLPVEDRVLQAITAPPGDRLFLTPGAGVSAAVVHIRAGRLGRAEEVLRGVLKRVPEHPAAVHLLGVVMHRRGDRLLAARLMRQSLELAGTPMRDWEHNLAVVERALAAMPSPCGSPPSAAGKASEEDGETL
ncbi:sulfotransferase [Rhodospirillum rubrum]|uniref:sulfotransferase n=1 Tax=Rhodospirillum rubrum TaxID=1085 RepID=UPI001F5BFBC3|nr:sulfotransferase [Rhodospirillum rubrum]